VDDVVAAIETAMSKPTTTEAAMNAEAMVTVKTYATELAAEAAAACLEANDIRCLLTADDCGGMLSAMDNYAGVKLSVAAEDAGPARDILSREGVPQTDSPEDEPSSKPASV
jgi:hypothetical protein